MSKNSFTTKSLNVAFPKDDPHRALHMPIYESVAFDFESSEDIAANFRGELPAHVYSRTGNPTVEYLEAKMKALTGAHKVIAVASGMAAISTSMLAICKNGDNIISSNHLFGHTYALFQSNMKDLGIEVRFCDLSKKDEIEKRIDENTKAIYFETVTNPQLEIANISLLNEIARNKNLVLVADSTLTPPNVFRSIAHGVNVEVMSSTKYISGGATAVGGLILDNGNYEWTGNGNLKMQCEKFGKDAFWAKAKKSIFRNFGPCMTAHSAYFQILGLDMLELRFDRSYSNCMQLGTFFKSDSRIKRVDYPGLPDAANHQLAVDFFNGKAGTIMTFDLETQGACFAFMNQLKVIRRATNLNDNKSLIIHPFSTIYNEFPEEKRLEMGIRPTMMRLSVGIEDADDLINDIQQALGFRE